MLKELTLESLAKDFDDGRIGQAFIFELRRCLEDLEDRPVDKSVRHFSVTCKMAPVVDDRGMLENVRVQFEVTPAKTPKRTGHVHTTEVRKDRHGAGLVFNDRSEDVRQMTIDQVNEEESED